MSCEHYEITTTVSTYNLFRWVPISDILLLWQDSSPIANLDLHNK